MPSLAATVVTVTTLCCCRSLMTVDRTISTSSTSVAGTSVHPLVEADAPAGRPRRRGPPTARRSSSSGGA